MYEINNIFKSHKTAELMIVPYNKTIKQEHRWEKNKHKSLVLWFTGLSGSGKSTIASKLEKELFKKGYSTYFLDADHLRSGLNKGLGFSGEDRQENLRRVGEVAKLFLDAGIIVLAAFISPKKSERELVKNIIGKDNFVEIFVNCPLDICEKRDPKGIYKAFREGKIKDFIGVDIPYEIPEMPDIELNTSEIDKNSEKGVEDAVQKVLDIVIPKVRID